ncbi:hypothetical protein [Caulobacter sp. X]|uniref:hypothetical protein n=1 Tax=Caulobacter sp. X TaxID=2048901 RepID=UPI000C15A6E2|nr:hypothetical protein [Caulobacter sp. X]PIC01633.1 hypothetical protein CSW60_09130 [Caulobacter sp. X]
MATLQVLGSAYADVARIKYASISTADLAKLQTLADQVDAATMTLTAARAEIGKMAIASTSVANLSYAFFTGVTPKMAGLDYLVSPTGGNANNLNSAYYTSFSAENRYINFSVNLGKTGEGAAKFQAAYGALDLTAAATKAYTEIFGFAPAAGKIDAILNDQVPNGQGGTYTRGEYFASFGGDGLNGQGTKAAMVGWLLNEAAKADLGVYAKANDAFLADLAADGQASFNVDLLGVYGQQTTFGTGATITVTSSQSVAPDAATPSLRSTGDNDTVTGTDSNASQSILTVGGHDVITFSGAVGGYVDGGDGNDTISAGQLNAAVEVLGGAPNGKISGGAGNDLITISKVINGAIIDGGAGDDTLVMGADTDTFDKTKVTNVEHLALNNFKLSFTLPATGVTTLVPLDVGGYTGLQDITLKSADSVRITQIADGVALKMDGVSGATLSASYHTDLVISGMSSTQVGVKGVHAYLSGVTSNGATKSNLYVTGNDGALTLHVQSDSVLGTINSQTATGGVGAVIVTGVGRLTAGFVSNVSGADYTTYNLDASGSGGIDITGIGADAPDSRAVTVVLSSYNDSVAADLRGQSVSTYTLGAGADVFKLYQDGFAAPRFSNLSIQDGKVATYSTITDFAKGVDHVNLGVEIPAVVTGLSAGSATTLEQALINVSGQVAANATAVFEYAGDTYIYHQDATVAVNAGDGLIRLVGVTGLTVGTGAASADIHYG